MCWMDRSVMNVKADRVDASLLHSFVAASLVCSTTVKSAGE